MRRAFGRGVLASGAAAIPQKNFGLSGSERPILFKLFGILVPGGGVEPP